MHGPLNVKLTAHPHLLPRLRISEAISIPAVCYPLFIFTPLQYDRQYFPMKLIHTYSVVGMFTVLPAGWSKNEFRFPIGIMRNFFSLTPTSRKAVCTGAVWPSFILNSDM